MLLPSDNGVDLAAISADVTERRDEVTRRVFADRYRTASPSRGSACPTTWIAIT